ncbi:MAG TPA: DNA-binding transcriptional regulator [Thermoguttaceae bacterium]|nr:DNA-binding transcriptional regulator [Thermoguttaceae bacterium]
MRKGKRKKRVALVFTLATSFEAELLRSVTEYAGNRGWILDMNPEPFLVSARALLSWPGDGVLAFLRTPARLRTARSLGIPVVNMAGALPPSEVPRVMVDQEAIGKLAAEHFLERGFRRTAYFGQRGMWYSRQRQRGFVERIRRAGGECRILEAPQSFDARYPWYRYMKLLEDWLQTLKTPVGLMAVHDYRARMVLDACARLGLRVPQDVALIGVDNNEVICTFSEVPLTSVARDGYREGYEAAALLDRLMEGHPPPKGDILIPPQGVVARASTDIEAIENPHVAAAVRLIREHLGEPFGVELLESHLSVSRRYLYYHFQQCLGCTPYRYINRMRVERAKQLLAAPTRLKLYHIARECGFSEPRRLRLVFRRLTGMTLGEYRRLVTARR